MIKNKKQKAVFAAVGVLNTTIDFSVLFILKSLGLPTISANTISTTVAFCFSFFANKKYTFKSTGGNIKREIALFLAVTLFGLWVLQNIVIVAMTALLSGTVLPDAVILFIAKICAVIVSMTWNYILYSRIVFKRKDAV